TAPMEARLPESILKVRFGTGDGSAESQQRLQEEVVAPDRRAVEPDAVPGTVRAVEQDAVRLVAVDARLESVDEPPGLIVPAELEESRRGDRGGGRIPRPGRIEVPERDAVVRQV